MINVTAHCYKRYVERIKEVEFDSIEQHIQMNKNQYHTEIDKMFENSRKIYTGRFNDKHNETNFRIADNIILITDKLDTKVITLYRVEFGFDREVDVIILKSLIEKLNIAEELYLESIEEVNQERERVVTNRDNLSMEIEALKESLKAMEESLEVMDNYIEKFDYKETQARLEMDTIAKKIVYSNIYRKEMTECL